MNVNCCIIETTKIKIKYYKYKNDTDNKNEKKNNRYEMYIYILLTPNILYVGAITASLSATNKKVSDAVKRTVEELEPDS